MHASDKPRLNIRAIRESRGYTQEYMAEMLDICQSTYANLESGRTQLSIDRLFRIADILETDFSGLVENSKKPRKPDPESVPSVMGQPLSLSQDMKGLYEELIHELRNEIDFLRSLIRPTIENGHH
jgi:XRE family transcriptional regulator, regulator of sulfur utilization